MQRSTTRSRFSSTRSVGQNPIQPAEATDLQLIFVHLWRFSGPPAILWGGCIEPRVRELVLTHAPSIDSPIGPGLKLDNVVVFRPTHLPGHLPVRLPNQRP